MRLVHVTRLVVGILIVALAGCASGKGDPLGVCDPALDPGCSADANPDVIGDAGPTADADTTDAGPMRGFGEACSDKSECASDICLLVGIGGICSDYCSANSCPDEFGCFGVLGVGEPGEVVNVCVPLSSQLCSPCELSSECALVGADLCLPNADGRSFCSRDCSAVTCPDGFTCTDVDVGGTTFSQCLVDSGACDCTELEMGSVESCAIATDFGTCEGSRVCNGATGWGTCDPPSGTDRPDGTFADDNCDGIDGELDGGVFVASNVGGDGATCGLTPTDPCATIGFGIIRALQSARGELYVQAGDYGEVVVLVNGIDIYGGYDANWQRDTHTDAAHRVTITGAQDTASGGDDEFLTIRAHNLVVSTTVADLVIVGPDASGASASGARSSYAVHIDSAALVLERVSIVAGRGANGANGGVGLPTSSPTATAAMNGARGGNANEFTTDCNDSSHGTGGSAGTNSCSGRAPNGGTGGNGGEMDTGCSCFGVCVCGPCDATSGVAGSNAAHVFGSLGTGGGAGSGGGSCSVPSPPGRDGRIQNGGPGTGASGGGFLNSGYWFASAGTSGGLGQNGGGGGGGGGSGGCDTGIDSFGAGGGGGGAGGCSASSAGGGGGGGGGSFGVFVTGGGSLDASDCTIQRGVGGNGGRGGNGGHGQRAGSGALGGLADGDSKAGGAGGKGAHGGHGGGGGGGAGGISVGVYSFSSTVTQSCVISGGSNGAGGTGGLSAPAAPVADRDGNDGAGGSNGTLDDAAVCVNASGC